LYIACISSIILLGNSLSPTLLRIVSYNIFSFIFLLPWKDIFDIINSSAGRLNKMNELKRKKKTFSLMNKLYQN